MAVNWALYGSAGQTAAEPGLVIERFAQRAAAALPAHRHYKTILRPAAFAALHDTPHLFRLHPGFITVHADGSLLQPVPGPRRFGMSRAVPWVPLRLNHYAVKSREEFFGRKQPRGRATGPDRRGAGFFARHDRNDEADPMHPALVQATLDGMQEIRAQLAVTGWDGAEPPLRRPVPASEFEERDRVAAQQVGADHEQAAGEAEHVER